jgi:GNAT superfamily N-acetyltransferase
MSPRSILRLGAKIFLVRRKLVFEADLDEIRPAESRVAVRFRPGDPSDLLRMSEAGHDYDRTAQEFALERLCAGDRLTLAQTGNQIVFYSWLMFGQLDLGTRRYLPLSADTAYLYRLFTVAAYRGRGLAPAYFGLIRDQLRQQNLRRVVSWVEARNLVSRRVFEAAGFREIGCIWHVQFLFRSYFLISPTLRARLREHTAVMESAAAPAKAAQQA